MSTQPLNRTTCTDAPAPPVRIVHLGLGAFHRAHQLWYTQHSEADPSDPQWGFASFTGRSPRMSDLLGAQDGLFTLMERGPEGDEPEIIGALADPRAADDVDRLWELLVAESTAAVTLTITEAAYNLGPGLSFDASDETVARDLEALRGAWSDGGFDTSGLGVPESPAAKLVVGLSARRAASAGPIAIVSCDNLSGNDAAARSAVQGLAAEVDAQLGAWIEQNVSFVGTSIDRITPATEDSLLDDVAEATGFADQAPVVTEPFRSWVLQGDFPAGRPEWERAGAVFVDDLEPFERRKLWLLNGSHSLMAYAAQQRGHETVAEAIGDETVRGWVEAFWDEAQRHLTAPELEIPAYRAALIERFENPRIRHSLAQIAGDGSAKLQMRAVPLLRAEREAGRSGEAAARLIAAWTVFLEGRDSVQDAKADAVLEASRAPDRVRELIRLLDRDLAQDDGVVEQVQALAEALSS